MTPNSFRYILRCGIEPGHHVEERLAAVLEFCKRGRVDDVAFHCSCEDLNQGHLPVEQTRPWVELMARAKPRLAALGVTTSINPWITFLHADRGRRLHPGQDFHLMMDYLGTRATAQVCPLCPNWRAYYRELLGLFASIAPDIIWIEDDFRFHNHAPLVWGGCFCDLHMAEFSRRLGRKIGRREFFDQIVRPGKTTAARRVWLDTNRDTNLELGKMFEQAVHAISPSTSLGLMCSLPNVHAAEGRDWHGLMANLSGPKTPIARPHLPAYAETAPGRYLYRYAGITPYTQAVLPEGTILYPELDNYACSNTRFSKSCQASRYMILLAGSVGQRGVTMNIFDMMGNAAIPGEGYDTMLRRAEPFLDRLTALGLNLAAQRGITIPVSTRSSRTIRTREGKAMTELYPTSEIVWSQLLTCLGIASVIREEPKCQGEIVAVSGQYFRNLSAAEIRRFFATNKVLLDGEAVETLLDLGLGGLAGAKSGRWLPNNTGVHAYEQIVDGNEYCGLAEARISAQETAGDYFQIEYRGRAECKSVLKSPAGADVGPGMVVVNGRVAVWPYGRLSDMPYAQLTPIRQALIKAVLTQLGGDSPQLAWTLGEAYLPLFVYELGKRLALFVFNCATDEVNGLRLHLPGRKIGRGTIMDSVTNREQPVKLALRDGVYTIDTVIPPMEAKLLVF